MLTLATRAVPCTLHRWHDCPSWRIQALSRQTSSPPAGGPVEFPLWNTQGLLGTWFSSPPCSGSPASPETAEQKVATQEQIQRTTAQWHIHLALPHPQVRSLLAWHCLWKEAGCLPILSRGTPPRPSLQGSSGPLLGWSGLSGPATHPTTSSRGLICFWLIRFF